MSYKNQFTTDYNIERKLIKKYDNLHYSTLSSPKNVKISFLDKDIIHKKARTTNITIAKYNVHLSVGVAFFEFSVVGKARCSAHDTFDPKIGERIASYRAQQKAYKRAVRVVSDVQQALSSNIKLINQFLDSLEYQCVRIPELD